MSIIFSVQNCLRKLIDTNISFQLGRHARTNCNFHTWQLILEAHYLLSQYLSIDRHRQHQQIQDLFLSSPSRLSGAGTPSGGSGGGGFGGYKSGGVTTPGSVPSLRLTGVSDGPPPSVDSPASITPSPLPTPHSQPSSVPHHGKEGGICFCYIIY